MFSFSTRAEPGETFWLLALSDFPAGEMEFVIVAPNRESSGM
jgi:hypothetical protein